MKKSLAVLVLGLLGFWLLVTYPAKLLWGDSAVLFSSVAGLICLLPTALTLVWSQRAFKGAAEQVLLAVMGGMSVRLIFVIGVGLWLFNSLAEFNYKRFWIWIIVYYLLTLVLEMYVLLTRHAQTDKSTQT